MATDNPDLGSRPHDAEGLVERTEVALSDAYHSAERHIASVADTVRDRPLLAVGLAFAAGIGLSMLCRRVG